MDHLLQPGVLLDERYRVDHVLGEGGFGITYAAVNTRIGLKVAIKELFWRDHSVRNVAVSPEVVQSRAQDVKVFQEQKARFLKEARILRSFSGLSGIVRVIDYFETNGTAYIVMERVEGETLSSVLSRQGPMDPTALFQRALPLMESLDKIHQAGIIHRDISPDNIMVQPDGSLTLIDFGAARLFAQDQAMPYTTIAKASYSPGEQYDKNGRQGPWTDVYSLCATLYHCIVGAPPVGAVQRMFLDELKTPSEMGAIIPPKYEAILMKGLQLDPGKRYQSMEELGQAVRDALPQERSAAARGMKPFLIGLAVGLVCLLAAVGLLCWRLSCSAVSSRAVETEKPRATVKKTRAATEPPAVQPEDATGAEATTADAVPTPAVTVAVATPTPLFYGARVGDEVQFGHYEQDNVRANGSEPITWIVLHKQGDRMLVLSKYALNSRAYHEYEGDRPSITWEQCALRAWLNQRFYSTAFDPDEQDRILEETVPADVNPKFRSVDPGKDVRDKIFLLSVAEADLYFDNGADRICYPTAYALASGADTTTVGGSCWWWLRSPGNAQTAAALVSKWDGSFEANYIGISNVGIRPAMWIRCAVE